MKQTFCQWVVIGWLVLMSGGAARADELRVLGDRVHGHPPDQMMHNHLLNRSVAALKKHREAMTELTDVEALKAWQAERREWFIQAIGGLPPRDAPLNAQVTGTVQREGFRVEKILFESQPNHHVTAALFLPDAEKFEAPYPVVLLAAGHVAEAKGSPTYQRGAILMAMHGIAVLMFDPIDQGERLQLRDETETLVTSKSWLSHMALGVGNILLGTNVAQFMIHDAMRCIDYLETREDIDASRIGVAGQSGGGTQTALLMAVDDRIKAAAPSCYITSFEALLKTIQAQDAEQIIAGQVGAGYDHWTFLVAQAPLPVLVCAATEDFFDIDGTRETVAFAREIFERFDAADRIDLTEEEGKHSWHQSLREATAQWMVRWLRDEEVEVTEPEDLPVLSLEEIQATPTGEVLALENERTVYDLNRALMAQLRETREVAWADDPQAMLKRVAEVTGIRALKDLRSPRIRQAGRVEREGYHIDKFVLTPQSGISLPALVFVPNDAGGPVTLWLNEAGMATDESIAAIEKLVREGRTVMAVDLRGLGETHGAENELYHPMFGHDGKDMASAYLLGTSYVAMRAEDVLVAARVANGLTGNDFKVDLVARGAQTAVPALHAAALQRELFGEVDIEGGPESFEDIVTNPLGTDQLVHTVHGALTVYDLPDLRRVIDAE